MSDPEARLRRLSNQFSDYDFGVTQDDESISAVAYHRPSEAAVGSVSISTRQGQHDRNARYQRWIDTAGAGDVHGDTGSMVWGTQPGEQLRWTRGNMDAEVPHVSWAGLAKGHSGALLSGLAALAVHHHQEVTGSTEMPTADSVLSDDGARFSRASARRWGVQGHPDNPEMHRTFGYTGEIGDARAREHAWGIWQDGPTTDTDARWSGRGVAKLVTHMDQRHQAPQPGETPPKSRYEQMKLL